MSCHVHYQFYSRGNPGRKRVSIICRRKVFTLAHIFSLLFCECSTHGERERSREMRGRRCGVNTPFSPPDIIHFFYPTEGISSITATPRHRPKKGLSEFQGTRPKFSTFAIAKPLPKGCSSKIMIFERPKQPSRRYFFYHRMVRKGYRLRVTFDPGVQKSPLISGSRGLLTNSQFHQINCIWFFLSKMHPY